jgi:cation transport ATPase
MRAGIVVNVTRADRRRLEAIVADRSAPQKHVWRANIILATADGCGTAAMIAAALGFLPPVEGALLQEVIDVAVIFNALRALRG